MQDENEVKTNSPQYHALVISEPTHLKITLIAKFSKKIPHVLWHENVYDNESPYFDSLKAGSLDIASKYEFTLGDLMGTGGGVNHQAVVLKNDSSIDMQEFMISNNVRKTETEIIIRNISPETVIKIMSEIDKQKFLKNGGGPEDLYIKIRPENHPLENKIKDAYRDAGFNLLHYDPTMTNIRFFLSEASSVYRLGMFNYAHGVVRDFIVTRGPRLSNPSETIDQNKESLENAP